MYGMIPNLSKPDAMAKTDAPTHAAVDCHFHLFAPGQGQPGARYVPAYGAEHGQWAAIAAQVGIRRGVLVQTSFMGTDNSQLLAELAAHPHTLRAVAVVQPDADADDLCAMHERGVRGIRLNLAGASHDLHAWQQADALWQTLAALGWHLEVHTDTGRFAQVCAQLPAHMPLVLDHMGRPDTAAAADATLQAARRRQASAPVWVKLSGAYRLPGVDAGALARLWLDTVGPERLLWGSDWPCTNHEACADYAALHAQLTHWLPDVTVRERVRVHNPASLYWEEGR